MPSRQYQNVGVFYFPNNENQKSPFARRSSYQLVQYFQAYAGKSLTARSNVGHHFIAKSTVAAANDFSPRFTHKSFQEWCGMSR